jgi:hypothetical protein
MIGGKVSRVLGEIRLEDVGRNSPRDNVTIYQLTHFHITESCNICIMSFTHFALWHTFRKSQKNDGLLDGFRVPQFKRAHFVCRRPSFKWSGNFNLKRYRHSVIYLVLQLTQWGKMENKLLWTGHSLTKWGILSIVNVINIFLLISPLNLAGNSMTGAGDQWNRVGVWKIIETHSCINCGDESISRELQ